MVRKPQHLYRNARSGELMELFMVSAASSLLITRFFLRVTGYPSVGGRSLHVAHMLWGGILMMIAVVLLLAFIGIRVQRRASVIAGLGFGLFIDELGKFITRDNNYFFRPTVALIYLVFVILFVIARSLSSTRRLTQREYLLNAVAMTEEVVIYDLDEVERRQTLAYLHRADPAHPLVPALTKILEEAPALAPSQSWWHRWTRGTQQAYERFIARPGGTLLFNSIFSTKALGFLAVIISGVLLLFYHELDGRIAVASVLELTSASVSAVFVLIGVVSWRRTRLQRYRLFLISLLIDIFVTQFFSFYLNQFEALPGFMLNIVLYIGVRSLIKHEQRLQLAQAKTSD